jgi:ribosome-binding factor A
MGRLHRGSVRARSRAADEGSSHADHAPSRVDHKTLQLCRQAAEAIASALAASEDEVLRSTSLISVEPAPDASRLAVIVEVDPGEDAAMSLDRARARLEAAAGAFRHEVAQAISRKRVPTLAFWVVPGGDGEDDR